MSKQLVVFDESESQDVVRLALRVSPHELGDIDVVLVNEAGDQLEAPFLVGFSFDSIGMLVMKRYPHPNRYLVSRDEHEKIWLDELDDEEN